ncbi:hypothetical protein [Streptacidiphilus jiangxiensis]|uniref:Uncharacterized protein n=1 Tax=Streptacidiphilus jiangxiensis TaxID=235985 RepID=A0A1H7YF50_STRJI|nr:hypothetical protein [Streptacidiphilus jiangxiensis]SEM44842.1 hypothetical protein SAMN05414137_12872 [Streptacidiphilus jiangxiensis]
MEEAGSGEVGGDREAAWRVTRGLLLGCAWLLLMLATVSWWLVGIFTGFSARVWYALTGVLYVVKAVGLQFASLGIAGADDRLEWYLQLGFWWGVAACAAGIRWSAAPGSAARRTARVAAGILGMALSIVWPLQAGVVGLLCLLGTRRAAQRSRRARAGRVAVAALSAVALVGGSWWLFGTLAPVQDWTRAPSTASLTGRWHGSDGEVLDLHADGTFSAAGFPPGLWAPVAGPVTDLWTVRFANGSAVLHFDVQSAPDGTSGPIDLVVYGFPSPSRLCLAEGPDSPCDPVFSR